MSSIYRVWRLADSFRLIPKPLSALVSADSGHGRFFPTFLLRTRRLAPALLCVLLSRALPNRQGLPHERPPSLADLQGNSELPPSLAPASLSLPRHPRPGLPHTSVLQAHPRCRRLPPGFGKVGAPRQPDFSRS